MSLASFDVWGIGSVNPIIPQIGTGLILGFFYIIVLVIAGFIGLVACSLALMGAEQMERDEIERDRQKYLGEINRIR